MSSIFYTTAENTVPEDHIAGYFEGFDGKKLRYGVFRSTGQNAKGTIVLLQGRNECCEKYFETIRYLTKRGYWVATFDWRGQGGSERILKRSGGFVNQFSDYKKDMILFLEKVVLPDSRMPFFILAHSMGGLIALAAAPKIFNRIDRIALISPFIGLHMPRRLQSFLKAILQMFRFFGLGKKRLPRRQRMERPLHYLGLTTDRERYERNQEIYRQLPELETGRPTVKWLSLALSEIDRVMKQNYLQTIRIPTIILAGTKDSIVPFSAYETIGSRFRAGLLVPFDGAHHELLHEADIYREPALEAVLAFYTGDRDV